MSEQQLIEGMKSGDEEAFTRFFEKYRNTIYNFGIRFCGNPEDASDILQDTLINTFKYIHKFKGNAKLTTWLYRIASNACLQKRRKENGGESSLDEYLETSHEAESDVRYHPHDTLEQKESLKIIEDAILKLPADYRIPFLLREVERLPHQEIADILETSLSNAKVRVHRARLMLRDLVSDYFKGASGGV
ncbi:MAG: RNA polymerase sigma factor [Acidobacteria bacterium]|nr:MAG: RNA polymerase sigma factor [Acidobacteriota bacterium]RLE24492.1 MAG: RNA polymerase sigma factor [Acidobacteriota bacterium]